MSLVTLGANSLIYTPDTGAAPVAVTYVNIVQTQRIDERGMVFGTSINPILTNPPTYQVTRYVLRLQLDEGAPNRYEDIPLGLVSNQLTWTNDAAGYTNAITAIYAAFPVAGGGTVTNVTGTAPIASSGGATPAISLNDAGVTFAKMQNIATDSLIGRDTAGTGVPENITLNATLSMTGAGALQRAALTGDVTAAAGSNATTIAADAVTNAKLADMAAGSVKANVTGGSANPTDVDIDTTFKTALALAKADVGLGNVDNTSDANKPISAATQAALDDKAFQPKLDGSVIASTARLCMRTGTTTGGGVDIDFSADGSTIIGYPWITSNLDAANSVPLAVAFDAVGSAIGNVKFRLQRRLESVVALGPTLENCADGTEVVVFAYIAP